MKRRTFLIAAVGGAGAIAGCYALAESGLVDLDGDAAEVPSGDTPTETPVETPTQGPPDEPLKDPEIAITDTEFVPGSPRPGDRGCLRMTVENVGGYRLSSIDLRPQFFDADGHRIQGAYRSLHNLDPGESWLICDPYPGSGTDVDGHVVGGSLYPGSTVTDPGDVELLDGRLQTDACWTSVSGAVRNTGDGPAPYVQALVKFYSADDTVVASGFDHTLDIESGGLWEFDVRVDTTGLVEPATRHTVELSGPWWG